MLDLKFIRENRQEVEKGLKSRRESISLEELLLWDKTRREFVTEVEKLKHQRKELSSQVAVLKRKGEDITVIAQETKEIGTKIKELDQKIREIEEKIEGILLVIPNLPDSSVPIGNNLQDNKIIKEWGTKRTFDFEAREHWEIGTGLNILDFNVAAKLAGSRFSLLKGKGALLERALIDFMLTLHIKEGYEEVIPPFMVSSETMRGTGQLPKFEEELYKCKDDDLYLIPTAEVPLTNIYRDQIISEEEFPLNFVAYTPCFRREAGSYGKDTKGLIRNHQFNKVELVKFVKPENSEEELEKLLVNVEKVLQLLEIPYRVIILCSGDLGFSSAKTYDIEVWMPGEKRWREISSCSNFTDFQARRMNIKYRESEDKKLKLVHTLNGSGLAIGRTFAAILENYQQKNGSVKIPKVLESRCGEIII